MPNQPPKSSNELSGELDPFLLEELYPEPGTLFASYKPKSVQENTILVALDTNALLAPYQTKSTSLNALEVAYKKLGHEKRLFVPARAVREFVNLRDRILANTVSAIQKRKQEFPSNEILPHVQASSWSNKVATSHEAVRKARDAYVTDIDSLVSELKGWRGDDPVTIIYAEVLKKECIVDIQLDEDSKKGLQRDWTRRRIHKIPPGYKDGSKDDGGIGDFLIWKSLLRLGGLHKKDLAFVTAEKKSDWYVKADGAPIYPRFELIDEYRRASEGGLLRLMSLHELLSEMGAPEEVVSDIESAEREANTAIHGTTLSKDLFLSGPRLQLGLNGQIAFDYSTNDGKIIVGDASHQFILRFSKASDTSIYLYKDGTNLSHIARVKGAHPGQRLDINNYDTTSRVYTVHTEEHFLARNNLGQLLQGKILEIKDDTRGSPNDGIIFDFVISSVRGGEFLAL